MAVRGRRARAHARPIGCEHGERVHPAAVDGERLEVLLGIVGGDRIEDDVDGALERRFGLQLLNPSALVPHRAADGAEARDAQLQLVCGAHGDERLGSLDLPHL